MREKEAALSDIQLLLCDVDGILTDGTIQVTSQGEEILTYSVLDGYGILLLREYHIEFGVISAKQQKTTPFRMHDLHVKYCYWGQKDKEVPFHEVLSLLSLQPHQVAYMGDDVNDICLLKKVGFAATVQTAHDDVFPHVHYVCKRPAGHGAVREVCDLILTAHLGASAKND